MAKDKKHILILPKWYPNPADLQLGIFVQNHAALISAKYHVTILYVQGIPDCPETYLQKTIEHQGFTEIRVYFKQSKALRRLGNLAKYRKAQQIGLAEIDRTIDLVHVQVPIRPALIALSLKQNQNIPYIITEHWSGHLNGQFKQKPLYYRNYYKKVLNNAKLITAVGLPLANELKQLTNVPVQVVPNYIQKSNKDGVKLPKNRTEIVTVADLNNVTKNITGLLKGFKEALREDSQLQLTIIGDGPDMKLAVDTIISLDLKENVILLGRKTQQEVLALLPQYHFYICNSNTETFGMTVAEAILAELPVICTNCGGPEAFVNANNGLLIEKNNDSQLKEAIIKMANTYQSYNTTQASENIRKEFGQAAILAQWHKIYQAILP